MLDVRKPIGYLFVIIGSILVVYAIVMPQITSLTIAATGETVKLNLDLPCGAVMLVFGAVMLSLAFWEASSGSRQNSQPETK